jgi:drug/metabolite transporter (DMT)-like permease
MTSQQSNLTKGIITALAAAFFLSCLNMFSKILVEDIDPPMVTFWRNLFAIIALSLFILATKQTALIKTQRPWAHLIRGCVGTIGMVLGVWMFSLLPITEGTVLSFTSPLFIILLSYPLLREKVGIYRVTATIIGFTGVLIMVGFSGTETLTIKALMVGFGFALCNAFVLIMLRQLGKTEHALTTVFYFMVTGLVLTGFYMPFADKIIPDVSLWWVVIGLGIAGTLSLLFKTESYRHGDASIIAPIAYTMLIWSAFFDYVIWDYTAGPQIWIGAAVIVASNLFIIWREKKIQKDGVSIDKNPVA